jgi:hypothetical protein
VVAAAGVNEEQIPDAQGCRGVARSFGIEDGPRPRDVAAVVLGHRTDTLHFGLNGQKRWKKCEKRSGTRKSKHMKRCEEM